MHGNIFRPAKRKFLSSIEKLFSSGIGMCVRPKIIYLIRSISMISNCFLKNILGLGAAVD